MTMDSTSGGVPDSMANMYPSLREQSSTLNFHDGGYGQLDGSRKSSTTDTLNSSPPHSTAPSVRSVRFRRSFWRSSSDISSLRPTPALNPSASSYDLRTKETVTDAPRPSGPGELRRRKTDTLLTLRNSIFRAGRKYSHGRVSEMGEDWPTPPSVTEDPEHFNAEAEYYQHLRKGSISPPFNFQHVTHTAKAQLPPLETVEEKDLPGEFWSASAYQKPKSRLNGIKADSLPNRFRQPSYRKPITPGSRPISPSSRPISPSSRPISPVSRPISPLTSEAQSDRYVNVRPLGTLRGMDETLFDETTETKFDPDEGVRALGPAREPVRYPKRYSSLNALDRLQTRDEPVPSRPHALQEEYLPTNEQPPGEIDLPATPGTFYDSSCSTPAVTPPVEVEIDGLSFPSPPSGNSGVPEPKYSETASQISNDREIAYRANQPLPPLPVKKPIEKVPADSSGAAGIPSSCKSLQSTSSEGRPVSPVSMRNSRSANSPRPTSARSHLRLSQSTPSETRTVSPIPKRSSVPERGPRHTSTISNSSKSQSTPLGQATVSPKSKRSSRSSASARKSPSLSSVRQWRRSAVLSNASWEDDIDFCYENEAESTSDFNWNVNKRGPLGPEQSDGGVAPPAPPYHAHTPAVISNSANSSSETIAERRRSQLASGSGKHRRGSSVGHRGFLAARGSSQDLKQVPSPVYITPDPVQVNVLSPVLSVSGMEDENQKTQLSQGTVNLSNLNGVGADSLSDPESWRNSDDSRHRKSSSYGSYESIARPPLPQQPTNRWSVASASSMPDLLHSRSRSKLRLSKKTISAPLESLPQSPGDGGKAEHELDSTIVPRSLRDPSIRTSFVKPKPQAPGDRAMLTSAPKAVKRGRPASRSSRVMHQTPQVELEAGSAGPAWI